VLPKSSTPKRIESNYLIPELSKGDFEAVEEIVKGRHTRSVNMKDIFDYDVWPEEANGELKA
jgi:diketogulonate reductase-like aldo/keto reductase